jgi:hypothetical protein
MQLGESKEEQTWVSWREFESGSLPRLGVGVWEVLPSARQGAGACAIAGSAIAARTSVDRTIVSLLRRGQSILWKCQSTLTVCVLISMPGIGIAFLL